MLRNRLKILLAERDLKIKDVSNAIGISRNSLSNMSNHRSANISNDSLDKLCNYLRITPTEFWEFKPDPDATVYKYGGER
ncbi:helix-turn-helix domain-containing protein [Limosilactobacillus oris]|uniref:helix-turn-helix domain-containing protein n=1 Tax=Limosilactobacillus oris TaxID=1632 RepID=UPI0024B35A2B|nr:helix-turn-helix transcriptional regulator [Limosilactobacillus oris]WHO84924.1 helix-turn-helix transcriptional regulator [Limosilactobacillus oris]